MKIAIIKKYKLIFFAPYGEVKTIILTSKQILIVSFKYTHKKKQFIIKQ
jgi:hypothetical protein